MDIILFDDDKIFLTKLKQVFNDIIMELSLNDFKLALVSSNKEEIINFTNKNEYQVQTLFVLDIVAMDKLVGYEICQKVKAQSANNIILFITNYPSYIIFNSKFKIISFNVILKSSKHFKTELTDVLLYLENTLRNDYFSIYNKSVGITKILLKDIYYFEKIKNSHNVCVYYENGYSIFTGNLKSILINLNSNFIRTHHSFIVNKCKMIKLNTKNKTIQLDKNVICPFSAKYKKDIEKCLM